MKKTFFILVFFIAFLQDFSFGASNVLYPQGKEDIESKLKFAEFLKKDKQYLNSFNHYLSIISLLEKSKNPELLFTIFGKTIAVIDSIIKDYKNIGSKVLLSRFIFPIYEKAISNAFDLYQKGQKTEYLEKAFIYAEKNKNLLLIESLQNAKVKISAGIPSHLFEKEKDLSAKIIVCKNNLDNEIAKDPERQNLKQIAIYEKELSYLQQETDSLNFMMQNKYPKYYNLKHKSFFANIEIVKRKLLNSNTTLLEYFYTETSIYCFIIGTKKDGFIKISNDSVFKENLKAFVNSITKSNFNEYQKTSFLLYEALIKPTERYFSSTEKLIVIPDGILGYIPFECLTTTNKKLTSANYKSLDYLIYKYQFSYSPSATILFENISLKSNNKNPKIAAFAPIFDSKLKAFYKGNSLTDSVFLNLSEQRWSEKFLIELKKVFEGGFFIREQASINNFKEEAIKFDILHISSHTIVNDEFPMKTEIAFSDIEKSKTQNPFFLASDLYNMQFKASLVVLASCQTGIGQFNKCEGIMSLSHGFSYAGCPSLVYSLWEVDEQETNKLLKYFYEGILAGHYKDEALHKAKIKYLKESNETTANPFFWGGFVFSGDPSPYAFEDNSKFNLGIIIFLLLIVIGYSLNLVRKQ
ncbi:MAG: CHAT domain-containing protein [Bacteroidetes bacterium]|nr:CHAT domain-containing protein [Bacteroidota bacterium]